MKLFKNNKTRVCYEEIKRITSYLVVESSGEHIVLH